MPEPVIKGGFAPIYEELKAKLLKHVVLYADETKVQVLKESYEYALEEN